MKSRTRNRIKNYQNLSKIVPKSALGPTWLPKPFSDRFLSNFSSNLGPSWGPSWAQVGAMFAKKSIFGISRRHAKTTMISNTFWDPLGTDLGTILGSKIEPKSVQDRSQERSGSKCKYPQNHKRGRCFWACGESKSDQKSTKNCFKSDLKLICQKNTQTSVSYTHLRAHET